MSDKEALALHRKHRGKIEVRGKFRLTDRTLSLAYTPGVAAVSRAIRKNPKKVYDYTIKGNAVAIVTDGSKVLELGAMGPMAGLPVMEGKALLFRELAGIDAFPICLATRDPDKIIETIRNIAPSFGAINLEDIAAPNCFYIEKQLQSLGIPVMHDDQHATAIVIQAALMNAAKATDRDISDLNVVINGAGAAGIASANLLKPMVNDIVLCDSKGIVHTSRPDLNEYKAKIAAKTNKTGKKGNLTDALKGMDVFIGLSVAGALKPNMIKFMSKDPIIFALANPNPEIMPDLALKAGAAIVGTGRSDFDNQINNMLAFPGVFRGALDARAARITDKMKAAAATALARSVRPKIGKILPHPLEKKYVKNISAAVRKEAKRSGMK